MSGRLVVIPTPIGNLEDITLRALRWLKAADGIAAEDTRHTKKLLNHYQISKPLTSYYQEVEKRKALQLIERIQRGQVIALVTDAGMPGVSDPGQYLIDQARQADLEIEVLPGPSALTTAVAGSGWAMESFSFYGFPKAKAGHRQRQFAELKNQTQPMIFFVAPHKVKVVLQDMLACWGDRPAVLCRELTKIHEEYLSGSLANLISRLPEKCLGEMTLIVSGCLNPAVNSAESMSEHLQRLQAEGKTLNQAIAAVAKVRGVPRADVYRFAHQLADKQG